MSKSIQKKQSEIFLIKIQNYISGIIYTKIIIWSEEEIKTFCKKLKYKKFITAYLPFKTF